MKKTRREDSEIEKKRTSHQQKYTQKKKKHYKCIQSRTFPSNFVRSHVWIRQKRMQIRIKIKIPFLSFLNRRFFLKSLINTRFTAGLHFAISLIFFNFLQSLATPSPYNSIHIFPLLPEPLFFSIWNHLNVFIVFFSYLDYYYIINFFLMIN